MVIDGLLAAILRSVTGLNTQESKLVGKAEEVRNAQAC